MQRLTHNQVLEDAPLIPLAAVVGVRDAQPFRQLDRFAAAYGVVTDAAYVAAVVAAAGATQVRPATPTYANVRSFVEGANLKVIQATGAPASAWIVAPDVYATLVNVKDTTDGAYFVPQSDLLPTLDPNAAAGTNIVTNGIATRFHESGPFNITDDVVSKLGRDVALYGYGAHAAYLTLGIVKASLTLE